MIRAARRTPRAESIETLITTAAAPMPKMLWRTAKWNGSAMCRRAASAGLEVKESITPVRIRSAVAPRSQ